MGILNFLTVYLIIGFVIAKLLSSSLKSHIDGFVILLIGYGLGPFLVSLTYLYLYLLFPSRSAVFYMQIFYFIFIGMLLLTLNKINVPILSIFVKRLKGMFYVFKKLNSFSKILVFYILFVILFIFVRGFVFPTTSGDALKYLKQGRLIADTRDLQAYYTSKDLLKDVNYEFNQGIRPGLPILYSQFYLNTSNYVFSEFSSRFVYFYYFILLLTLLIYIVHSQTENNNFIVYGLVMLMSSFSFVRYLIRPNYKEIILIFLTLLWLFLATKKELFLKKGSKLAILSGSIFGWMMFINYSGFVLMSIALMTLLVINRAYFVKCIKYITATVLVTLPLSGAEVIRSWFYIFKPSRFHLLNRLGTFTSQEIVSYKMFDEIPNFTGKGFNWVLLLKAKLDLFTQPYIHGFIFWVFTFLLIVLIKKRRIISADRFLTGLLLFIAIYFFVFKDPLFLNPHKFAYVLSISEKFVGFLAPFVAIFIIYHYEQIIGIFTKFKYKYLYFTYTFLFFLISPVRKLISKEIFTLLSSVIRIYRAEGYYVSAINRLLLVMSLALVFLVTFFILRFKRKNTTGKAHFLNLLFIVALFILPFSYSLNTNFYIGDTFTHLLSSRSQKILAMRRTEQEDNIYTLIYYLREDVKSGQNVLVATTRYHDQIEHFLRDYHSLTYYDEGEEIQANRYDFILAGDTIMPEIQEKLSNYSVISKQGVYSILEKTKD